jgi:hypothetical protein
MTEFMTTAAASASYGELCDFYNANKDNIETLQNTISALGRQINERDMKFANAKALILEAYDCDDFSEDRVQAIAEALEIELTKEYDVTITVTFSGSVTLPLGVDIDDIENYVDFDVEANRYKDDVEVDLFASVDDVRVNN